jgi:2-oxoisovalerate dehydrogenase E1 component alpha subunit
MNSIEVVLCVASAYARVNFSKDARSGSVVDFPAEFVQLVTPDGERVPNPDFDPWVADVTGDQLAALYEDMTVVRRIDAEATALQRQGELGLWPPLLGQ